MRSITRQAVTAFMNDTPFRASNTDVRIYKGAHDEILETRLELHGNGIARKIEGNTIEISTSGWKTNVTKERLNGIPNVSIYQKNHVWYLNGTTWDGSWITI